MYIYKSRVRFSESDEYEKLTLGAMLNYLQDCSVFHSEDIDAGIDYMRKKDKVWMLCSWQIIINERPRCFDYINVGTQAYKFAGPLAMRNFRIWNDEGKDFVLANSVWCLVDIPTMKPVRITEEYSAPYEVKPPLDMNYESRKIKIPENGISMEPFTVSKDNIDSNHHVNNSQYILMSAAYLKEGFKIGQIRAEYRKQARTGDVIIPVVTYDDTKVTVQLNAEDGSAYALAEFTSADENGGKK